MDVMDTKELLDEAMNLPAEARAALAAMLIESLDDEVDSDAELLWAEEIARRSKELDEGAQTIPWAAIRVSILGR